MPDLNKEEISNILQALKAQPLYLKSGGKRQARQPATASVYALRDHLDRIETVNAVNEASILQVLRTETNTPPAIQKAIASLKRSKKGVTLARRMLRAHYRFTGRSGKTEAPGPREPQKVALAAYRLYFYTGKKQEAIANALSKEFECPISQGQVSRWIKEVGLYLKARNILPALPPMPNAKANSVDPSVIDMGERTDHRTRRQRPQRSAEGEDENSA